MKLKRTVYEICILYWILNTVSPNEGSAISEHSQSQLKQVLVLFCLASTRVKSEENVPNIDYAQTVLSLQEKLSRINSTKSPSPSSESGLRINIVYLLLYNCVHIWNKIEKCSMQYEGAFCFYLQCLFFISYYLDNIKCPKGVLGQWPS